LTSHDHRVTVMLPDVPYAALRAQAEVNQRSVASEAAAILADALSGPCKKPSAACPLMATAYEGGNPIAAVCGRCDRLIDPRANPIGNSARY